MNIAEALRGLLAAIAENPLVEHQCVDWDCDGASGDIADCGTGCRHKAAIDALAELDADVVRVKACTGLRGEA